jgi:hypothetical protein
VKREELEKQVAILAEIEKRGLTIPKQETVKMPEWLHPGQVQAWGSDKRIVAIIAGSQGGKTSFLPHWLLREVQNSLEKIKKMGSGEFLVVSPTYTLLYIKCQPEFKKVFAPYATFIASPIPRLEFTKAGLIKLLGTDEYPVTIFFRYAENSENLESVTALAACLDEAGQTAFKQESFEAINRRLAINNGRICIGTTPYVWNWLKFVVYDQWAAGHPDIDVVKFRSIDNPVFEKSFYEAQKSFMPAWRHAMMYDGDFTRPAGQIYDCLTDENYIPRFDIPEGWDRVVGLDFGQTNTAGVYIAIDPSKDPAKDKGAYILYGTYHRGGLSGQDHAKNILSINRRVMVAQGGAPSEDDWRKQFARGGLPVLRPQVKDVEVGIDAVYNLLKRGTLVIFDDLDKLKTEFQTYSRKVNESGEVVGEDIENKNAYHRLDALRYIALYLVTFGKSRVVDRRVQREEKETRLFDNGKLVRRTFAIDVPEKAKPEPELVWAD